MELETISRLLHAEGDTEASLESAFLSKGNAEEILKYLAGLRTSDASTSPLAAQQPVPPSSWANALHDPKPLDLEGHGNWRSAQLVSSERMQTGQSAVGPDADVPADRQTEASLDAIARNAKRNWLKPTRLVVVTVFILLLIVVALLWQFWLSGFFRHF